MFRACGSKADGFRVNSFELVGLIDSGLMLCWGLARRGDALFWDRPRVVYHRLYLSIRRLYEDYLRILRLQIRIPGPTSAGAFMAVNCMDKGSGFMVIGYKIGIQGTGCNV